MISILFFTGVTTVLAVLAMLAKTSTAEPRAAEEGEHAEKEERGKIIKQLLALAERENSISAIAPPASGVRLESTSATHDDALGKSTYSHMNPTRAIPLRPNLTDAEIEEQIRQRAYELYQGRGGDRWKRNG